MVIVSVISLYASGLVLTRARSPLNAFFPAIALAAATCSVSDNPLILLRKSSTAPASPIKLPSPFFRSAALIPRLSRVFAASPVGAARLAIVARNDVPMEDASIPLFAIMPIAVPNSSMDIPKAAAGAPAYCIANPKSAIPILDALAAA